MRLQIRILLLALMALAGAAFPGSAFAQTVSYVPEVPPRFQIAFDYNYYRTNAPPGACGCFGMNGGSGTFDYALRPSGHFDLEGDISVAHSGSVLGSHEDLTLGTYTVGVRYRPMFDSWAVQPFAHVLIGAASSSGSLTGGGTSAGFAAVVGGGLDLPLPQTRRVSIRLAQFDYVPSTFHNGSNGVQNNFRVSAGIIFNFK